MSTPVPAPGGREGRRASPAEAIAAIPNGARVFVAQCCGTPTGLVDALTEARDRFSHLELVLGYLLRPLSAFDHPGEPFAYTCIQASGATAALAQAGHLDIVPARFSDNAALFAPGGNRPVDVALVQVSPPGPDGRVSLGVSVGSCLDVVSRAPLVIAQVNPQMPYVLGEGELGLDAFDLLVDIDEPLVELPPTKADETTVTIARTAAGLIPDGATLQFGIGAMPDLILGQLVDRRGFRVHSGMVSGPCIDLAESGAVTGTMVAAEILGDRRLFDWVDRNPQVRLVRAAVSHGAASVNSQTGLWAINSTIEVALDGSANSEVANGRLIAGPGGAPDYAFGASVSSGGRLVMALPSTAARGSVSRIVPRIEPPGRVTLPAYTADLVVTEWGVASLRGLTMGERADALRAVAHPDHRPGLV